MGQAGESVMVAHNVKKMDARSLMEFRDRFHVPLADDQLADFGNRGPGLDLVAPGAREGNGTVDPLTEPLAQAGFVAAGLVLAAALVLRTSTLRLQGGEL